MIVENECFFSFLISDRSFIMKEKSSEKKNIVSKKIFEQRFDNLMMMIRIIKMLKSATIKHNRISDLVPII